MAAQIVAPVAVEHVGSGGGEFRQITQHFPLDEGVTGEAQLVAMAAQAAPTVVDERTLGLFGGQAAGTADLVVEEGMVQPEGVAQARHILAFLPLLPVQPPEIHALLLQGMQHGVEIGIGPGTLVHAERHAGMIAVAFHIATGAVIVVGTREIILHESRIHLLPHYDTGGRVQVQGGLQVHAVHLVQESFGVLDEVPVPGIAGPADALAELVPALAPCGTPPGLVPVHVNHHHVDGQFPLAEFLSQRDEFLVCIGPVAAPPVAEDEFRRHGDAARHLGVIGQGGLIVVSVGKQVQVLPLAFRTGCYPFTPVAVIGHKQVALALVHYGPAVAGEDAFLHGVVVVDLVRTLAAVQRAGSAHQVALVFHTGVPFYGFSVHLEGDLQVFGRQRTTLFPLKSEGNRLSFDCKRLF